MCRISRRRLIANGLIGAASLPAFVPQTLTAQGSSATMEAARQTFIDEAERMRVKAVADGDQSFGAVVVRGLAIVGWGASRVVIDKNANAHAERVAIWDAQARQGSKELANCVLYSTSRPCRACESEAAKAGISRMFWGPKGTDAGVPRV